jgi:hypothetical protein
MMATLTQTKTVVKVCVPPPLLSLHRRHGQPTCLSHSHTWPPPITPFPHKLALRSHALHLGVRCKSRGLDVTIACVRAGGQFHHGCSGCLLPRPTRRLGQSPPVSSSTHIISTLRVRTPLTANTCSQAHPWPTYIVPRCLCLICGRRCMQWLFDSFDCCLFKHSASCTSPPHTTNPFTYSCLCLSQSERAHAQPATRSPTCTVRRIHSILHTHHTPHVILAQCNG